MSNFKTEDALATSTATSKSRRTFTQQIPSALAEVALIDAKACAATGDVSLSWWFERVARGEAPQPAIRGPRCTRWRVADVARYWSEQATKGANSQGAASVTAQAKKASDAARAKRVVSA